MAKSTTSSAFRKIDIDQYCEDNYKEEDADQGGPIGAIGPDETEVITLLNQYPFLLCFYIVLSVLLLNFYYRTKYRCIESRSK